MIIPSSYQGKRIGVFGLGRSGDASIKALVAAGATVFALDDDEARRAQYGDLSADWRALDFKTLDGLVLAPGVPLYAPEPHGIVLAAKKAGTPIISDFDLFEAARENLPPHKVIAITGTNGKSTTTALTAHILKEAGRDAVVGGNIGVPVMALGELERRGVYVIEASSFQLDITRDFKADVSILLNMAPDHLDRHGDMGMYQAAKARIFDLQEEGAVGIVSLDDPWSRAVQSRRDHLLTISNEYRDNVTLCFEGGMLRSGALDLVPLTEFPRLRGMHNHQNITAAYLACRSLGLSIDEILSGVASFPGLAHRQEWVGEKSGVTFINDSKATNVDAATRGLLAFDRVRWIAGGRGKGESLAPLAEALGSVTKAYLIGEEASEIAKVMGTAVDHETYESLADAVHAAFKDAKPEETVLLSPACTAFDAFKNFEDRGDAFKALARDLIEGGAV